LNGILVFADNRFTAGEAGIVARYIAAVILFQFQSDMCTGSWILDPLAVPT